MQIYSPNNELIYGGYVGDQSYRYKSVMQENNLTIYLALEEYIEIPIGSYVFYQRDNNDPGEFYYLLRSENLIKHHTQKWEYTIILESYQYLLRTRKFKFFTVNTVEAPDKPYRLKGWYTATAQEWLDMLVRNMNDGDTGWSIGNVIETSRLTLEYSGENCLEFLQKLANEFKTEWSVEEKAISLSKVEKDPQNPIPLSYGYDHGLLGGVKRTSGESEQINRLYVVGGERNIYRSKYGSDTLLIPKNVTIKYDGIYFEGETGYNPNIAVEYKTDVNGMYLERSDKPSDDLLNEGLIENTDIYPMREGAVTGVIPVDDEKALYDIVDADNTIDYNNYWADNEKPLIAFQTGMLSGKEFEINLYDNTDKRFELVPITDADVQMPKGVFIPTVGDTYGVFNIYVPDEYIQAAETELLKYAVKYFHVESMKKFIISGDLSSLYAKKYWHELGHKLDVGYFVEFSDPQFFTEPQVIRIIGVKDWVNRPFKPTLELSNEVTVNNWSSMKADVRDTDQKIEKSSSDIMKSVSRTSNNVQELEYLRTALQNRTEIDGGLLLTTLLKLGAIYEGTWQERAGINGAAVNDDDVIAWFGGTLVQAIDNLASIVFRMDGSGQLAKGNISWDTNGNIIVSGKYQSAEDGNRFVIDPQNSTLDMYDSGNKKIGELGFQPSGLSYLNLIRYDTDGTTVSSLVSLSSAASVVFNGLPTDSLGLPTNTVWNDNGTLKIVQ